MTASLAVSRDVPWTRSRYGYEYVKQQKNVQEVEKIFFLDVGADFVTKIVAGHTALQSHRKAEQLHGNGAEQIDREKSLDYIHVGKASYSDLSDRFFAVNHAGLRSYSVQGLRIDVSSKRIAKNP